MNEFEQSLPTIDFPAEKRLVSKLGFGYFTFIIAANIAQFLLGLLLAVLKVDVTASLWTYWAFALLPMYLIGAPLCWLIIKSFPTPQFTKFKLPFKRWLVFLLISITLMYAGNIIGQIFSAVIGAMMGTKPSNAVESMVLSSNTWTTLLFAVIIGPMVEELFFRKLLIDRLQRYGDKAAILISALMFGLFHGNLYQFFYAFALGVIFAYVYARTHMLRYSIALHMVINFMGSIIAPLILQVSTSGQPSAMDAMQSGNAQEALSLLGSSAPQLLGTLLAGLYGLLIIGSVVAGLILLIKNFKKAVLFDGPVILPKGKRFGTLFLNAGMLCFLLLCIAVFIIALF